MYIQVEEMNTVIDAYKICEITDSDQTITESCILAAEQRVASYLGTRYDVGIIFSQRGENRNAEILEITKNIALWFLIRRHNVDILYPRVKDTYDRDIEHLKLIASGKIASNLPLVKQNGQTVAKIKMGSNKKFKHYY